MAGRAGRGGGRGRGILGGLLSVVAVCVAVAIIVDTGAWGVVAPWFGLRPVADTSQLGPDGDASRGLGLRLPDATVASPTPTTPQGAQGTQGTQATPQGQSGTTVPQDTQPQPQPQAQAQDATTGVAAVASTTPAQAAGMLDAIPTETPHTDGYDRDKDFGGWAAATPGCGRATTRDTILARDLSGTSRNKDCKVTAGLLHDPYTGRDIRFQYGRDTSARVQIDHVVALADAWASGLWRPERAGDRERYANSADVLLAVDGDANVRKSEGVNLRGPGAARGGWGASTPSVWLPDDAAFRCSYMAARVRVKHEWGLSMSVWEKAETASFLNSCTAE